MTKTSGLLLHIKGQQWALASLYPLLRKDCVLPSAALQRLLIWALSIASQGVIVLLAFVSLIFRKQLQ